MSVQTWASWAADWAKAQVLTSVIAVPLLLGMYAIIRRSPERWWFYFWLLTLPVIVFLIFVTPIWIDPLFNTFEPLAPKEPQLVEPIERVLARAESHRPARSHVRDEGQRESHRLQRVRDRYRCDQTDRRVGQHRP